jgi:hypothetical protein
MERRCAIWAEVSRSGLNTIFKGVFVLDINNSDKTTKLGLKNSLHMYTTKPWPTPQEQSSSFFSDFLRILSPPMLLLFSSSSLAFFPPNSYTISV